MVFNNSKNLDSIFILQEKSIRIINFATFNHHTNPLFLEDKIIKFPDIIILNQLMLVQQFNNKTLPRQLENLMEHTANIHNHFTRTSSNIWLLMFGIISPEYTVIYAITIAVRVLKNS